MEDTYIKYIKTKPNAPNCGLGHTNNNYDYVFSKNSNRKYSNIVEPNINYSQKEIFLHISSNDRDTTNYPLHYDYRVNFDTIKNIRQAEIVSVIFPNQPASSSGGDILNEPFLMVDIPELNFIEFGNLATQNKAFSILPLKAPNKTADGFIVPETRCMTKTIRTFNNPISLSNLTIKIRDVSGNLYDFGASSGSTNKKYQNAFTFKFVIEEVDRNILEQRNIY